MGLGYQRPFQINMAEIENELSVSRIRKNRRSQGATRRSAKRPPKSRRARMRKNNRQQSPKAMSYIERWAMKSAQRRARMDLALKRPQSHQYYPDEAAKQANGARPLPRPSAGTLAQPIDELLAGGRAATRPPVVPLEESPPTSEYEEFGEFEGPDEVTTLSILKASRVGRKGFKRCNNPMFQGRGPIQGHSLRSKGFACDWPSPMKRKWFGCSFD